jgi:hypothetical protein
MPVLTRPVQASEDGGATPRTSGSRQAELPGEADQEGIEMPRFMDYHDDLKLPPEAIEQIAQGTREGVSDEFGVRQIELRLTRQSEYQLAQSSSAPPTI